MVPGSRHESLITFSNVNYYDSTLITFPSPVTDDVAVRFERVHGVYDRGGSRTNRIEAEAIVKGIETHYLTASKSHLTIGVVTFNQPQQSLIETLLDARRRSNPELDRAIAARSQEPLFIKNLENVQGDERDVIFFSITFGPDSAGKTTMNFGPLNGEGGHRRLNVAISRVHVATPVPKKSASSVHTRQPIAMAHARTGQSHPGRWPCHSCQGGLDKSILETICAFTVGCVCNRVWL